MGIFIPGGEPCKDWIHKQRQASFKGAQFEVEVDDREGGRRGATHEYPSREFWDDEDLGRRAQIVHVAGYVCGDDAEFRAQDLFERCNSPGDGLLILPLRTQGRARCDRVVSTFEADAMGRYRFEMEFVLKAPDVGGVVSKVLLAGAVTDAVNRAIYAVLRLFVEKFDSVSAPPAARDAAAETIIFAAQAIDAARQAMRSTNAKALAETELGIRRLITNARSLAYQGQGASRVESEAFVNSQITADSGLSGLMADVLRNLADAAADPEERAAAFAGLTEFTPQEIESGLDADSVQAELRLTAEVGSLTQRLALLHWANSVTGVVYRSRPEAVTTRTNLTIGFEPELDTFDDPDAELAFRGARDAAVMFLSKGAADLAPVIRITLARPMPAVVIATALYNDALRSDELVARNAAQHPLFMPSEIQALRPQ